MKKTRNPQFKHTKNTLENTQTYQMLSFEQERMFFADMMTPGNPAYHIPGAFRIVGPLNKDILTESISEVIKRHEILRTTYRFIDGKPAQVIAFPFKAKLTQTDLSGVSNHEKEVQREMHSIIQEPFNIAEKPPWRVALIRVAENEHILIISMHNILCDGDPSLEIFCQEIWMLYEAFAFDKKSPLPELPLQYKDYSAMQQKKFKDGMMDAQLDYWLHEIGDEHHSIQLPTDRPYPSIQTYSGDCLYTSLSVDTSQNLSQLASQMNLHLSVIMLAAFKIILHRYSGQTDILIGIPAPGRDALNVEKMIGYFGNPLVLRSNFSDNPGFRQFASTINETLANALSNQDYPFQKLLEIIKPERDVSRPPLFQVLFAPQDQFTKERKFENLTMTRIDIDNSAVQYDLMVCFRESTQGLLWTWEYNKDLFDRSTIERMAGHFGNLLDALLYDPDQRVCEIPFLSDSERRQILEIWNGCPNHVDTPDVRPQDVVLTSSRRSIENFDILPHPDRTLVAYSRYHKHIGMAPARHTVSLQFTRGCPFLCLYCHKIWPKKQIFRSAENIFEEIKRCYDAGIRRFAAIDDTFNLNEKEMSKLLKKIIRSNIEIQLFFPNGLRADILSKEFIDLMVEAGTVNIDASIESASPRMQKIIRKNLNLAKFRDNLEYIIEKHPNVILDIQMMIGFPTETREEAIMTYDFLKSLKWIHFPYLNILKIYPGTEMAQFAIDHGVSNESIEHATNLAFHELPKYLPFPKSFVLEYQGRLLSEYFLSRERLLNVLPAQMKVLTKNELVQKYATYLPIEINSFSDILQCANIDEKDLGDVQFIKDDAVAAPCFDDKIRKYFPMKTETNDATRLLLLDLSMLFEEEKENQLYTVYEAPLGLMYLLTHLNEKFGKKICGKISKSRVDFKDYDELKVLIHDFCPDIIGIRTLSLFKEFFHKTVSMIKKWHPDIQIITGGPYATSEYEYILSDKNVDIVVRGEGELTFAELVGKIIDNDGRLPKDDILRQISGIAFVSRQKEETAKKSPRRICVHEIFELQAEKTPNTPAVEYDGAVLSYQTLNRSSNQLANYLLSLGLKKGETVGLCLERSLDMITGVLGIIKAGGACLPLDPEYPQKRLAYMLSDSGMAIVIATRKILDTLPMIGDLANNLICIDENKEDIALQDHTNLFLDIPMETPLYCIYTSGSTGKPKGVIMPHRGLSNVIEWDMCNRMTGLKMLMFSPISFDVSFHEIFHTLCTGGTLVLTSEILRRNPLALTEFIAQNKIEKLYLPFVALQQLAEASEIGLFPDSLKEIMTAGEQLQITPDIINFFKKTGCILHNHYGSSECVDVTAYTLSGPPETWPVFPPVGKPLHNTRIYILDRFLNPVPIGVIGELYAGGDSLATGYINRKELTEERFIKNPFGHGRLFKIGDLAKYLPDGNIQCMGRVDHQVKIRGFRIETGEIEAALNRHASVSKSAVITQENSSGQKQLAAYVELRSETEAKEIESELRVYLKKYLPEYMIPSAVVILKNMPRTPSGKIDRRSLSAPESSRTETQAREIPKSETQQCIAEIWQDVLNTDKVGIHDNFFEIGGNSLMIIRVQKKLMEIFGSEFRAVTLFQYPTIHMLAEHLSGHEKVAGIPANGKRIYGNMKRKDIAIIGIACRFPGAKNANQFWKNLVNGVESIEFFSDEEMDIHDRDLLKNPDYVKAGATLSNIDMFDADFFGYTPRDARITDPQQRILLECAWEAFEDAGYNVENIEGLAGVFIGSSMSTYLMNNVAPAMGFSASNPMLLTNALQTIFYNDRSNYPTRISYKLNLTGPSMSIQTTCSTSLVTVYEACMSLLAGDCDIALAGGAAVSVPQKTGYLYQEGMIFSQDGRCRAFDANAKGMLFGSGVGLVLLKPLEEAVSAGDHIYAVIKGTAVNNDGALKMDYSAPSVEGQAAVISKALDRSGIDAGSISYVETHGTGTKLGDPIEIEALTQAFQRNTKDKSRKKCPIGSVKSNIGHTDEAAGVAGLIKTALALKHGYIPPSLNFETPNPEIDFENIPFYVNTSLREWKKDGNPRRAGVSSFGMGGTNCHVILEEASPATQVSAKAGENILALSAKSPEALQELVKRYHDYLEHHPDISLSDLCFTANTGRKHFEYRFAAIAGTVEEVKVRLKSFDMSKIQKIYSVEGKIVTGSGESLSDLAKLYQKGAALDWQAFYRNTPLHRIPLPTYPFQRQRYWIDPDQASLTSVFRQDMESSKGHPIAGTQYYVAGSKNIHFQSKISREYPIWLKDHLIHQTVILPGTAYLEMAIAAGTTISESKDIELKDVIFQQPMVIHEKEKALAVQTVLIPEETQGYSFKIYSLSSENKWILHASGNISVSNETPSKINLSQLREKCIEKISIKALYEKYQKEGINYGPCFMATRRAWRNKEMALSEIRLPDELKSESGYMLHPVLLDACLQILDSTVSAENNQLDSEALLPFAVESLRFGKTSDDDSWWCFGERIGEFSWNIKLLRSTGEIVADIKGFSMRKISSEALNQERLSDWMYLPEWQIAQKSMTSAVSEKFDNWYIFADVENGGDILCERLRDHGQHSVLISTSENYEVISDYPHISLNPLDLKGFQKLIQAYSKDDNTCAGFVYLWGGVEDHSSGMVPDKAQELSLGALYLLKAIVTSGIRAKLWLVTQNANAVTGQERLNMAQSPLWGLGRTICIEHPELSCVCIDLETNNKDWIEMLLSDLLSPDQENQIAYRAGKRYAARLIHRKESSDNKLPDGPFELKLSEYGGPENLYFTNLERRPPDTGEVEIEVIAAALNFRDIMNTLGMLKDYYAQHLNIRFASELRLGFECAGRIVALGEGVNGFEIGDEVMADTEGAFASFVNVDARKVMHKPSCLSMSEAASIPTVFSAAYYGLHELADMKAGEKILIHSAAGGVGQAAVQLAKSAGAQIFATASPGKWDFLKSQGIPFVMNSRNTDFTSEIMKITDGKGVDIVLNSLSGNFIEKSFSVLAQGGRFVEIGKTDVWDSEKAEAFRPDVTYYLFDMGEVTSEDPKTGSDILAHLKKSFEEGKLKPPPLKIYAATHAVDAFRYMLLAKHIGKIVLDFDAMADKLIRKEGIYLITGGLGGLGLKISQWLAEQGAGHLLLAGRSGANSEQAKLVISELEAAGTCVKVVKADISKANDVKNILNICEEKCLRGIIHAAGILEDCVLQRLDASRFAMAMAPKVRGAWLLHRMTANMKLDFFVCFSSSTSILGYGGQGNYAAANAFLDALAHHRRKQGLPAHTINWGAWSEVGMSARMSQRDLGRMQAHGEGMISPDLGVQTLGRILKQTAPQLGVLPIRWPEYFRSLPEIPPFLSLLHAETEQKQVQKTDSASQFSNLSQSEVYKALIEKTATEIQNVLGLDSSQRIDPEEGFFDMGLDSLTAIELRNRLQKLTGLSLGAMVVFDYPSVKDLANYLAEELSKNRPSKPEKHEENNTQHEQHTFTKEQKTIKDVFYSSENKQRHEPIAIVGMSCKFPDAPDLDTFWRVLRDGIDTTTEIPSERWDLAAFYDPDPNTEGKMYIRRGAFLKDVDKFDAQFFGISPREAESMDPRQRILLEVTWEAFENAGINPDNLRESLTGVYLGLDQTINEYGGSERMKYDPYTATGCGISFPAGRISYILGLQGPSMGMSTTCSSSLVAIHTACQNLKLGECDLAVAGGIQLNLRPEDTIQLCKLRALSPEGRCKTFDASADGYSIGEGCGVILLKRLSDAEACGDRILGIISGGALNHNGRSAGLTVPNGNAQEKVIADALKHAGLKPSDIAYVEAHGTGTSLGDPIEILAMNRTLGQGRETPLLIASVKTNIGHLEEAAGIAGFIKILLSFQHKAIPPHLHFNTPNPHISWSEIPLKVNTELSPWPEGRKKIAGLSSFGMSGTNAHVILEAYEERQERENVFFNPPYLVILSAKKEDRLKDYARRLMNYLEKSALDLSEIAYTLQVGRSAMEERLATLVSDIEELKEKLSGYVWGLKNIENLWYGNIKNGKNVKEILLSGSSADKFLTETIRRRELETIARLWIAGTEIDWLLLYNGRTPRKIALPTYPFARERYWISGEESPKSSDFTKSGGNGYLHPLLHTNTSDLSQQRFTSTFSGKEFFLADHVVKGRCVLPGVAYLEMARVAVEHAVGNGNHGIGIRLKNVVWARPIAVTDDPVNLHIALYPEEDGTIAFEVYGDDEYEKDEPVVFNQGSAFLIDDIEVPGLDIPSLKAKCDQKSMEAEHCYEIFTAQSIEYGPGFRGVEKVYTGDGFALARLRLPSSVSESSDQFVLHPSLMDSALQASIGLYANIDNNCLKPALPFALESLEIFGNCKASMWAFVRKNNGRADFGIQNLDVDLCDDKGNVCARMKGFSSKVLELQQEDAGRLSGNHIDAATMENLYEHVKQSLIRTISDQLKIKSEDIDEDIEWQELGFDSISISETAKVFNKKHGLELEPGVFFEYSTIRDFLNYLIENYADLFVSKSVITEAAGIQNKEGNNGQTVNKSKFVYSALNLERKIRSNKKKDIAIIGLSGRYPKARNVQEFLENLREGLDCVSEIPKEKWDHSLYFDDEKGKIGKTYCKWGGFIDSKDCFDPMFFNISPEEAAIMAPQERLFLECVWNLLEDAGYTIESLQDRYEGRIGVFVGAMSQPFQSANSDVSKESESGPSISITSLIANRVSYFFNFRGPSVSTDTMCSSAGVSLHHACESIKSGDCKVAVAGGINLTTHPKKYIELSQAQLLASDPNSRSFAEGDGYLPCEGIGAVLLKPLEEAVIDNDSILAVIKSTAINHGGRTSWFSVPNPKAQMQLIEDNFKKSGIDPKTVSYVESAAYGSSLVDSIEFKALVNAFGKFTRDRQFCAIGSVKSNIGHPEAASTMAQLAKVVLQFQDERIFPSIKSEPINPNINFEESQFYLQRQISDWKRPVININGIEQEFPRRATISSFGAGGSNAHIILEEYRKKDKGSKTKNEKFQPPYLLVLSAKDEECLKIQASRLLTEIRRRQFTNNHLPEIAYTLQTGREAMEERIGLIVGQMEELESRLEDFLAGKRNIESFFRGRIQDNKEMLKVFNTDKELMGAIEKWMELKKYSKLLDLWTKGFNFDWNRLYGEESPGRISLPGYPFAKQRSGSETEHHECQIRDSIRKTSGSVLHESRSDKSEQLFDWTFSEPLSQISITDYLAGTIQGLLELPEPPDPMLSLSELGLRSLMAVELRNILISETGLGLAQDIVFEYPTIEKLSVYLFEQINRAKLHKSEIGKPVGPEEENSQFEFFHSELRKVCMNSVSGHRLDFLSWTVRPATMSDVSSLSLLEEEEYGWLGEEAVAPPDLIAERIELLNSGDVPWFWVLERTGELLGWEVSQPTSVDPYKYRSWAEATDNGTLKSTFDPEGKSVYLVAGGISKAADEQAGRLMTLASLLMLKKTGKYIAFSCLAMPGYRKYFERTGKSPEDYLALTDENGIPLDPFIAYMVSGWPVKPSFRLLPDGYPPDRESMGHGVSTVFMISDFDLLIEEMSARIASIARIFE
jgi:amino acid adenylation domain-containing protein